MPRLIDKIRRQKAILWRFLREDQFGNKVYDDPVEIDVRWEESTQQFLDRMGNTQISRAQVFVGEKIEERSILWKGSFAEADIEDDSEGNPNPFVNEGAYEVRQYNEQPDMKAKKFLRYVMLLILCSWVLP